MSEPPCASHVNREVKSPQDRCLERRATQRCKRESQLRLHVIAFDTDYMVDSEIFRSAIVREGVAAAEVITRIPT